jgi:outer membrane protein TolC
MKNTILATFVLITVASLPAKAQSMDLQTGAPEVPGVTGAPITASAGTMGPVGQDPFLGGVPTGQLQPGKIPLSLDEAISRGLKYNLGVLLTGEGTREARGAHWRALSNLLPNVSAGVSESAQQINLAALGFPGFPGIPQIVGPFSVFDARGYVSQTLFDLHALERTHEESNKTKAAEYTYQNARDLVVLVCANLYLQSVADSSRAQSADAQVKTAQALYDRAADLRKAGVVAGIDVLRAQVELQAQQQRLIYFQNEFAKRKLSLGRAIGLPIGQEFTLTDAIPYSPMPPVGLDQALDRAYSTRADFQAAKMQVQAAEAAKKAALGHALPSLHFNGDYGDIGNAPGRSHGTFTVAATLKIPLFQGGRVHGEMLQADAQLAERRAQLEDLRARIAYEVRSALLDLKSSSDRTQVARSARDLAHEQLQQAQDRFSAGVVSSIEVVQAQDALATADENYISSLYAFNVAKASLARALGVAEKSYREFIGGRQ